MHQIDPGDPLRQGDICAIPHIPIWLVTKARVMSSPEPREADSVVIPTWDRAAKMADGNSLVVVASQCCDLENPKKGNRVGVLVAPLMGIPASPAKEAERYAEIVSSQKIDPDLHAYRWIQLFPFTLPNDGREVVADMSAMTTMAPAADAVSELQQRRLWTLEDDERHRFRIKLGAMSPVTRSRETGHQPLTGVGMTGLGVRGSPGHRSWTGPLAPRLGKYETPAAPARRLGLRTCQLDDRAPQARHAVKAPTSLPWRPGPLL